MADIDYPIKCIAADGYRENPERGSTLHRAEDGTPWIVNLWPETKYTFEIRHPALSSSEQLELERFYDQHIGDEVRWFNPRRQNWWRVRMVGPPRLSGMRSGLLGDVDMTLAGEMIDAPTNSIMPVVSGLHQIGQVITVSQGAWESEYPVQFEYQWLRNGEPIAGATDQNYTLVDSDLFNMISVRVTATSFGGSTSVETEPVRARLDSVVSWLYSDMAETIFVDVDGNTPATWGDPVGRINDSSGNGNDFTQPTVTARPILGRVPMGGRRNLLIRSGSLTNAAWVKRFTVDGLAPDVSSEGRLFGVPAFRVKFTPNAGVSGLQQPINLSNGQIYTLSCFIQSLSGTQSVGLNLAGEGDEVLVGTTPVRVSVTVSWSAATGVWSFNIRQNADNMRTTGEFLITGTQLEVGTFPTPYQQATTQYDITESGVPDVHYLDFDLTDDNLTTTLPAIENGTVVIAGTNGIWIDDDYNFDGGTFSIGPTTYTGGPAGILEVIGDPITEGFLVIDRQLSSSERARVITRMKQLGAPGVFELGPELVVNGGFSDGLEGWNLQPLNAGESAATLIEGGVRIDDPEGSNSNFFQYNVFAEPGAYLISWEILDRSGGAYRLRGPTVPPVIPAGGKGVVAQYTSTGNLMLQNTTTAGDSFLEFTNLSTRKLELIP